MKKIIVIVFGLLLLISCVEDKVSKNKIFNPFQESENIGKSQYFNLDTVQLKEITGKYGTKIYFDRNSFNLKGSDKVILELKELYSIEDLITNNIRTITNENDLLESSGVIYLNFTRNGEKLNLPDNSSIRVKFPINLSNQDKLFNGKIDSLGQISWSKIEASFMVIRYDKTFAIDVGFEVTLDSLPYYQKMWKEQDSIYESTMRSYEKIESRVGSSLSFNKLGWINIDRFVEEPVKMDLILKNKLELDGLVVYVIYENLNSFISYYPEETQSISLRDVPVLEKTFLVAVGIKEKQLFAEKVLFNKKSPINLNLVKVNQSELNQLLRK
tara:strand:- start:897 stop:1880 length:984 start_codon:yes stop_codon:yes gene_type:complete